MKQLTLIRHAAARQDSPSGSDFDRPLSTRGQKDATRMAEYLKASYQLTPQHILCSPASRTVGTAYRLVDGMGLPAGSIQWEKTIYEAPVSALLLTLQNAPDAALHVCMVGHNPGMEELCNFFTGRQSIQGFATCGVAQLELDIAHWRDCGKSKGRLMIYDCPDDLWER